MKPDLEHRLAEVLRQPRNLGELEGADSVGTVGNAACGEMLRMWIKFKHENGRKVIDRATFQSFGCETAIAVASLATELIRGKTAEEALRLKTAELAGDLGPLPPMKIHCAELVEGALRAALAPPASQETQPPVTAATAPGEVSHLLGNFMSPTNPAGRLKVVLLKGQEDRPSHLSAAAGSEPTTNPGAGTAGGVA